jgi:hypothetical protein
MIHDRGEEKEPMRIRTLAAATLVAAGLSVTLTGAASASPPDEPPPGGFIVTCEDGEAKVRPLTEEERAEIKEMRARAVEAGQDGKVVFTEEGRARAGEAGRVGWTTEVPAEGKVIFKGVPPEGERTRGDVIRRGEGPGEGHASACAVPVPPAP